jgi:predicted site-specific integrase-resolvase
MDFYTLTRKEVAEILKISTRTLDRYVSKKMFSTRLKKGKVYFNKTEIEEFLKEKNIESVNQTILTQKTVNIDKKEDKNMSKEMSKEMANKGFFEDYQKLKYEKEMYKNMYENIHNMFNSQQNMLKNAYYKIGQLEYKTLQITPKKENKEDFYQKKIENLEKHNQNLEKNLKNYEVLKIIYASISIGIIFFFSFWLALL